MLTTEQSGRAVLSSNQLEGPMRAVEEHLAALGQVLHSPNAEEVDQQTDAVHAALSAAFEHFSLAARTGGVPRDLRLRLIRAGGQLAAHREALARANTAVDRALDILLPPPPNARAQSVYGHNGQNLRNASSASLLA